jgi:ABC-2 type transport system permease protein
VKGLACVYRRELAGLFLAPLAWILLCVTLIYNAFFFITLLEQFQGGVNLAFSTLHQGPFWFLALFLPPLLTMRMISEESRSGLLEFLLTAPVGDGAVVLGKLLAATTFMAIAWSSVLLFGLLVTALGAAPDWGQVLMQWVGAVLVCALFSAIGLVSSALCGTPLLAAFLAILSNVLLMVLPMAAQLARGPYRAPTEWLVTKVDVASHFYGSFLTGALDTGHLVFFATWIAVGAFVAIRVVESRRWMG